jgi:UDP-glucose 4-epimerase
MEKQNKKILVTGGLGYIGSHTAAALIQAGYDVVIADNLCNSSKNVLSKLNKLTGLGPTFYEIDLCDRKEVLQLLIKENNVDAVIHFAALKAVGESVQKPLHYFRNNIISLLNVLECMEELLITKFVFSSSATVYGFPDMLPVTETTSFKKALSAYGSTKQMGEDICEKTTAVTNLHAIMLRYFNPVGAHLPGLLGEAPGGIPNNLLPFLTQAVMGRQRELVVYGNDYDTPDGTCTRDYIHVIDLAEAHVIAFKRLIENKTKEKFEVFNVGTGTGVSVLELIKTFEQVNGLKVPYCIGERRPGDAPVLYADVEKANKQLHWYTKLSVADMVSSAWKFEQENTK